MKNTCQICNHQNQDSTEGAHEPGRCTQCNCGESEIIKPTGQASYFLLAPADKNGMRLNWVNRQFYRWIPRKTI